MDNILKLLKSVFGYDDFRPGQEEIVSAIIGGENVLAIMPTGGGKSLCFQLPAIAREGITLVISPLIALMRDQTAYLRESGINAGALTSNTSDEERQRIFTSINDGSLKLLYMAPERLASAADLLGRANVTMLAIDEAHCVSQWGHDFRPDYLRIGELRAALGNPQITAFTATADVETRKEIAAKLFANPPRQFLHGFDRPNLFLGFAPKTGGRAQITQFVQAHSGETGIIYCASRRKVEDLADYLVKQGVNALPYHAGLAPEVRAHNQDRFSNEDGIVVAATVAFGMGVDKPDVRFVAHADLPASVEAYYQEVGRAGRDGLPANTLTLFGIDDIKLRRRQIDEGDAPSERKRADHLRLNALLAIAEAPKCRRQTLLAYFEETSPPCGNCDLCLKPPEIIDGTVPAQKALSAIARTGERYGVEHLIAILRGEATDRVVEFGHQNLPTFGVGTDFDKNQWRGIYRQLYAGGFASVDPAYGGWQMTREGWDVLRGSVSVQLRKDVLTPAKSASSGRRRAAQIQVSAENAPLLKALKDCRRELAQEAGVPAFVIFADKTLIDMAQKRPATLNDMNGVHGIGAKKLEAFGTIFLEIIEAYARD